MRHTRETEEISEVCLQGSGSRILVVRIMKGMCFRGGEVCDLQDVSARGCAIIIAAVPVLVVITVSAAVTTVTSVAVILTSKQ